MAGRSTIYVLATCYALSVSTIALNVAIAPIVGLQLAPTAGLATLPISLQILATTASSFPISMAMGRWGRRPVHVATTLIGAAAASVAVLAIVREDFVLFCIGTAGMGVLNSAAQLYRFAAADAAEPSRRARAISTIMAGGIVAGILGPALAVHGELFVPFRFAGSYVMVIGLYAAVAALLLLVRLPSMVDKSGAQAPEPPRQIREIARQPRFIPAILIAMMGYGSMALIMTATPVSMLDEGHSLQQSSAVIQFHVLAMFGPAFFTGRLIERFGTRPIIAIGMVAIAGTMLIDLAGRTVVHYAAALILLGIGWNFMFTSGTTMLTATHRDAEKARVQGLNDVFVFGTAAAGSFMAGYMHASVGWDALNWLLAPLLLVAAVAWWRAGAEPPVPELFQPPLHQA